MDGKLGSVTAHRKPKLLDRLGLGSPYCSPAVLANGNLST